MANTIITKNSSTASAVPAAGSLTQGELAVNVTDKKLYTKNASGTVVEITPSVALYANSAGNGGVTSVNGLTGAVTLSTGGVTSLNGQTGAITNTSLNAIGSYVCTANSYGIGNTIAGSSLSFFNTYTAGANTGYVSGTWRALGFVGSYGGGYGMGGGNLYVRIS